MAARTAAKSATSAPTPAARPPLVRISSATPSAARPSRSAIPTVAPERASRCAMARPMPRPPPVTRATAPVTEAALPAGREGRAEAPAHRHLPLLVQRHHLAVDPPLAIVLVALRHPPLARDGVAGPHPRRKAHLEAPEVLHADEVADALADEPGGQHPMAEDRRVTGHARELLVVVDRVEVPRRPRVTHQIRPGQVLDHERRQILAFPHVFVEA